jgi:2-oxoglutarate ferredoxin oxidoreductase subunit beta
MGFLELKLLKDQTTVISGIGCSGRSAGFFDLDTVHTAHGRAIPIAEGVKLANKKLNVVVLSGDGDLLGIGANHLIHAARRDTDLTVICVVNEIYGMTGGQTAPTTPLGVKTITSPEGTRERPVDAQSLVKAHGGFYARSTTYHLPHLKKALVAALRHEGFAFVEVKTQCITNYGRRIGIKDAYDMLMFFKETYRINDGAHLLAENEIGITS